MPINFPNNSKLIIISTLLSVANIGLLTNTVRAQPSIKSLQPKSEVSSLKTQDNIALGLHLILSRSVARQTQGEKFEPENNLELSQTQQTIPLPNQTLIANSFSGQASWYGPGFHGRLTANGEIYNQNAFTAAHPSLRFGTKVKVTNLNNGRSVIVRINDRGPYAKGRIIDVSAAAARSLGMIRSGIAPVRVTILGR
ncbi:MAG: septal ring lytic transglycosylase RlpA family protein [Pleurocapsa sp. MO_226.B13]|nr:septal ring lytic transglycosylase RlpA family protein [Pleurocapsa sp. MO_226.B13]